MAKLGVSLKIDLTKIDKSRIFNAKSGAKYIDLTTFIDTEVEGQYGDHGFIAHSQTKEERDTKQNTPICGNVKVFWSDLEQAPQHHAPQQKQEDDFDYDSEIPF